jgi:hypothetical protein
VRSARVLVVLAAVVLTVTGCTPERTNDAQAQGLDLMRAAELPIESISFGIVDGTVTAYAQRWVSSPRAPELDEPAIAKLLWQRSIADIDQIEIETIQDTGRALVLRRFGEQELTTRFGPRPAGVVQVTAEQMEREDRAFMGTVFLLLFGMPALLMVAAVLVVAAVVAVVVVLVVRRTSSAPAPFTVGPGPGPPGPGMG